MYRYYVYVYVCMYLCIWEFPKIGVPPNHPFIENSPSQSNHFGYPHIWTWATQVSRRFIGPRQLRIVAVFQDLPISFVILCSAYDIYSVYIYIYDDDEFVCMCVKDNLLIFWAYLPAKRKKQTHGNAKFFLQITSIPNVWILQCGVPSTGCWTIPCFVDFPATFDFRKGSTVKPHWP